ncbi:MAG: phage transcriptional regulator, AlpA [uncultured Caballeronia sp.]|nr:MAG: phage transcriptional regulator, AlpA [uncultured Caballeronia sp.]
METLSQPSHACVDGNHPPSLCQGRKPTKRCHSFRRAVSPLPFRRTIRRHELRQIVLLAETTIYEMERRGEFPRRSNLTPRYVVWDLDEVEAWIDARKQACRFDASGPALGPNVHQRRTQPVRNQ